MTTLIADLSAAPAQDALFDDWLCVYARSWN